ncbi:MFS transporter [Paenibacillaceae bacterium]|nr:MFS transporter [Paenibacillaceae bacterium]
MFHLMMGITRPFISLFAAELGADTFEIGMLASTYALLPLILAIPIGKAADRLSDRLPILLGITAASAGIAIPYLFPYLASLYVSQALVGISLIAVMITLQKVIGHMSVSANRDQHFGWLTVSVALSGVAGPIVGGMLVQYYSYGTAFAAAAASGLLPFLLSFALPVRSRSEIHPREQEKTDSALSLLRIPMLRKALATSALVLYSRDVYIAYFPLFASQFGMSVSTIGWIIGVQALMMVIVRLFLSRLTAKFGREIVLWGSIALAGCAFLLVPLSHEIVLCGFVSALMGAGLGCGQPLSMTTTYNASPPHRTGEVLGLRLAFNRLTQMIAPLFFGLVGAWAGIVAVFYVSGTFLIGGAMFAALPDDAAKKKRAEKA